MALPLVSLAGMRQVVALTVAAAAPEQVGRVKRGLAVLLESPLYETAELGVYRVQSCQDAAVYYTATAHDCSCPDAQRHPGQRCKHAWAVCLLHAASAEARWEGCKAALAGPPAADPDAPIALALAPRGRFALDWQAPRPSQAAAVAAWAQVDYAKRQALRAQPPRLAAAEGV